MFPILQDRDEIVARLNLFIFGSLGPISAIFADPYTPNGIVLVMTSGREILAFLYDEEEDLCISFATDDREIFIPRDLLQGKPN